MFILIAALTCFAVDGDTLRCGHERVRLVAIDAPEMPGHCRQGRHCVEGDPYAAKRSLERALKDGPITIDRLGTDVYGRTIADVHAGRTDLSCAQLRAGAAVYVAKWDTHLTIRRVCPAEVAQHYAELLSAKN